MPTPLSDGKHVVVWNGMGVAACFDLDGQRKWITRVETDHIVYGSSPALADGVFVPFFGQHIFLCDNQGTTVVIEPGRAFKEVARNRLDTVLDRHLPLPAQETLTYSPPITDGNLIFLRGERYLYGIGRE